MIMELISLKLVHGNTFETRGDTRQNLIKGVSDLCYFQTGVHVTLRGTNYTTNNSVVLLDSIGDRDNALECITDLSGCCKGSGNAAGEWHYPNGTQVFDGSEQYGFYRNRERGGQVFLRKRSNITSPTGTYCCEVPTTASGSNDAETFCAFLSKFKSCYALTQVMLMQSTIVHFCI